MSFPSYKGETCIAFLDVCGFKSKMRKGLATAAEFLDKFYTRTHVATRDFNLNSSVHDTRVRSLIVSDCAVIFIDNSGSDRSVQRDLQTILRLIKRINLDLITHEPELPIMTTCSIDYGQFKYEERIGFADTRKTYFLGEPYIKAFLDNKNLRTQPARCRVLVQDSNWPLYFNFQAFREANPTLILEKTRKHCYFYWMLNDRAPMKDFKKEYAKACRIHGQAKYSDVVQVLKKYCVGQNSTRLL